MKYYKHLITDLKKQLPLIILSVLLSLFVVMGTLYVPILVGKSIDCIVYGDVKFDLIREYLLKIFLVVMITALCQWLMNLVHNRVTFHIVRDMRNRVFLKIQKLPLNYLDTHATGDIVSKMIADVDSFSEGLLMGLTQLFTGILTIGFSLSFMIFMQIKMAILLVVLTPMSLLVAHFISKYTFSMFLEQSKLRGEQTALIEEMISNVKLVKAYRQEETVQERFDEGNEKLSDCSRKAVFYSSLTNPCTRFVNSLVYAFVAMMGAFFCIGGQLTVGVLTTFLSYANQYTKPFNEISAVIAELQNAFASVDRIYTFLNEKEEKEEYSEENSDFDAEGNISCEEVAFSYTEEKKLIEDFSLHIKAGQRVAIVGPTGCGKTTLINLFMRFYDVKKGSISVDGKKITEMNRHSLRKNYGMVLQESWLKTGSIRDNIAIGKEDASLDEIIAAAKSAHAHSFIKRLANGYDTIIRENDGSLSAGQKQLLCIARIMLSLPPMLILDEATSSIDTRTEMKIQNAFEKLMQGRTSLIVAHRLSTIQNADVILVMKDGQIIEQGNHEDLLQRNGFYAKLYSSQFQISS